MEGGLSELQRLQLSLLTSANIKQSYAMLTYFFRDAELLQIISLDVLDDPTPNSLASHPCLTNFDIEGLLVSALQAINIAETFARRLSKEQENISALVVVLYGVNFWEEGRFAPRPDFSHTPSFQTSHICSVSKSCRNWR
ncbi:hypothetical protein BCR33DRAFT_26773 [Rhizoclosmatium globosum]|uniref:Uncharacterized protein n=1 Tax=Rhizoclosmatium globosum TaxID=329046 RepID=A0A1Y2AXH4_9FUNG|nr:hypothetical protein BCR33DRAFT_26773 [Rhizoclosmatium globosum]|eukprot:ORY27293.1 hypothetical protein BCR33DRAFT_26773 [Rhizoclosmatium globosum]